MQKPTLKKAIYNVVSYSLDIKPEDRLLIITDEKNKSYAQMMDAEAKKYTSNVMVLFLERYGRRPLLNLSSEMLEDIKIYKPTAAINFIDTIVGEEAFRNNLITELVDKLRTRLAHLLYLPDKLFIETIGIDYDKVNDIGNKMKNILEKTRSIKVTSSMGTELDVELNYPPKWYIENGKYNKPGMWGNFPNGEMEILPKSINGQFAVAEFGSYFSIRYGVFNKEYPKLVIRDNRVVDIITTHDVLRKDLESFFSIDSNSNRVGEFALGINIFIEQMFGYTMIDEKKVGVHIGLGTPHSEKDIGTFKCSTHLDAIGLHSNVEADGKLIMKDDKLLI